LYAAFNKAIQLEAERKMPSNVMSRTTHSLAYRACAIEYKEAGLLSSSVPLWHAAKFLETNIVVANFALGVLRKFIASADYIVSEDHLIPEIFDYYEGAKKIPPFVDMAESLWESMKSLKPKSLPMTHDGYLKLYQLSEPKLQFDYILLDEAQDTTPCVWDIMSRQQCRKIVVGDEHQAIYQWRGSIDALKMVREADHFYLTQSFRFGPQLASLASLLLRRFKGETKQLRGMDSIDTKVVIGGRPSNGTLICRGNMHIFRSSASECEIGKRSLGFVGGDYKGYRFESVLDAYYVFREMPDKAKDPFIRSFASFEALKEFAAKVHNQELESACILAEEYGNREIGRAHV
jgi:hypothetical protein